MKFKILLLVALLSTGLKAQNIDLEKIDYSFFAAPNLNFISGDIPSDVESNGFIGWQFGFNATYKIDKKWEFSSGLNISRKGGNILTQESYDYTDEFGNPASSVSSLEQQVRLTYLNLPLNMAYSLSSKVKLGFGLQIGYIVSANTTLIYTNSSFPADNESISFNMLDDTSFNFLGVNIQSREALNRFELSGNLFSSYRLSDNLKAVLMVNLGLTKFDEGSSTFTDGGTNYDSLNLKNRSIILGLNYSFSHLF